MTDKLKMILWAQNFFFIPMKQVAVETWPAAGRTYLIHKDRIVAVAVRTNEEASDATAHAME